MNFSLLLLFSFLFLNATSQDQVVINVTVAGLEEGSKVMLVPETGDNWRDSTIVKNGAFQFRRALAEPTCLSIRLAREPGRGMWRDFYVGNGIYNIQASNGNLDNAATSGSMLADDFNDYILWVKSNNGNKFPIANTYEEASKLDSLKVIWSTSWVVAHPSSPISTYIMYNEIKKKISPEETDRLLAMLSAKAKENTYGRYLQQYADAPKLIAVGKTAPEFSQPDTSARLISLKDFRGKYVLVDFWASWCGPCRAENPNLVKAYQKNKDKNFTILSISLDQKRSAWIAAIKKDNLTWTHISDLKHWDNAIVKLYAISVVPYNLLLDPDGKILAINLHGEGLERKLAEIYK